MSGSGDSELDEVWERARGALAAVIRSGTALAEAMIEVRIAALRRAAAHEREQAQHLRDAARVQRQADAAVWRAAMRPQWWRQAGAEDIGRAWRAASAWQHVDPRAATARQVVVDRLAERGVHVDPAGQATPSPQDVAWLSDALDRAAAACAAPPGPEPGRAAPDRDGEAVEEKRRESSQSRAGQAGPRTADPDKADLEARAAAHIRAVWPSERAERVISCRAWGALAYQLGQLDAAGRDVEDLLRGVPDFVDRAHTPAAFAYRSIDDRLDGVVDLGTHHSSGAQQATEQQTESVAAQIARVDAQAAAAQADVVAERAGARRHRTAERDEQAALQRAEVSSPAAGGQAEADRARDQTELHAALADEHEARAAQLAAQGYPESTKEVVAAAAERAASRAAAADREPALVTPVIRQRPEPAPVSEASSR